MVPRVTHIGPKVPDLARLVDQLSIEPEAPALSALSSSVTGSTPSLLVVNHAPIGSWTPFHTSRGSATHDGRPPDAVTGVHTDGGLATEARLGTSDREGVLPSWPVMSAPGSSTAQPTPTVRSRCTRRHMSTNALGVAGPCGRARQRGCARGAGTSMSHRYGARRFPDGALALGDQPSTENWGNPRHSRPGCSP